jgi:hypothetical protein
MGGDAGCKRIRGASTNEPKNIGVETKNANTKVGVFYNLVARGGIEPPTQGFSIILKSEHRQ